ncbi:MAG TPA: fused MFS/spermidine synthase [bacterium]|nr:fused MFS/spermidine synthase [bacterium]
MKLFRYETPIYNRTVDGVQIQVIDRGDQRELRFGNHITQSARSLVAPDVLLLDYARAMMAGLLFVPKPDSVLHFGLGGGTIPDCLHRHLPEVQQRVVELNRGVVDVAYRYFDLPVSSRLEVVNQDGAMFLREDTHRYALIFLDAFHANGAAPQMNTATAFNMLRDRLATGGWLVVNAWGSDRELLAQVRGALRSTFEQLHYLSVRVDSNVIFIAGTQRNGPSLSQLKRRAEWLSQQFPLDFAGLLERLRPAFAPPRASTILGDVGA